MEDDVRLNVVRNEGGSLWAPSSFAKDFLPVERSDEDEIKIGSKYRPPILGEKGDKRLVLNPDVNKVMEIVNKIRENDGYCPSQVRDVPGCMLKPDTRCPCPNMMIYGKCRCGLFIETDLVPKKEEVNGRLANIIE